MSITTKGSNAPGTSLTYITLGAIFAIPAGTSFFFFPTSDSHMILGYLRMCIFLMGMILVAIGFAVGHIGRTARLADTTAHPNAKAGTTTAQAPPAAMMTAAAGAPNQPS